MAPQNPDFDTELKTVYFEYCFMLQVIIRLRASGKLQPLKKLVEDWRQKKFAVGVAGENSHTAPHIP